MVDTLVITGIHIPPYSTRAATQSITPIAAASQLARTVNGELMDMSDTDLIFRQFTTTISGSDRQAPEFCFPGVEVTVECLCRFWKKTVGGVFIRTPVTGSEVTDGDYTSYRPVIVGRVTTWQDNRDDWNATHAWQLTVEEFGLPEVTTT